MPLQNRVTPEGEIIATPHRGLMMGNRGGCFHLPDQTLGPRRWATRQWIACVLEFKGRHRAASCSPTATPSCSSSTRRPRSPPAIAPASSAAAPDAERFAELWAKAHRLAGAGPRARDGRWCCTPSAPSRAGAKRTYRAQLAGLPDGAFVRMPPTAGAARLSR